VSLSFLLPTVDPPTHEQRCAAKNGKLSDTRRARLDAVGFVFDTTKAQQIRAAASESKQAKQPKRQQASSIKKGGTAIIEVVHHVKHGSAAAGDAEAMICGKNTRGLDCHGLNRKRGHPGKMQLEAEQQRRTKEAKRSKEFLEEHDVAHEGAHAGGNHGEVPQQRTSSRANLGVKPSKWWLTASSANTMPPSMEEVGRAILSSDTPSAAAAANGQKVAHQAAANGCEETARDAHAQTAVEFGSLAALAIAKDLRRIQMLEVYMYIYLCVCVCVYLRACIYMHIYTHVYVCMHLLYIYMYIYKHIQTNTRTSSHTHTHTKVHAHTHIRIRILTPF